MSKKGLLNEATVRRFMGLAGMESNLVSNTLKEMYHKRDEEEKMEEAMYAEEEPAADAEMPPVEEPEMANEPEMADEPEMAADAAEDAEVELSPEDIGKLKALKDAAMAAADVVDMLDDAAAGEAGAEPVDDAPELDSAAGEEDAPADDADLDAPEEDEEVMEALSGINLELNEDELVQEVAKRVAKRLLRAKKAQAQLDEALGRKTRTK